MRTRKKRTTALLLALLLLFGVCTTALALNIEDHDLYDWFEYYKDGDWHDLNTVMYTDSYDGDIGYCIEHEAKPPRPSIDYVPYDISNLFNDYTLTGIQAILNRGYPADNHGFSDDDAFYATANALRFWIKESCGQGYDFMILSNGHVRVKSGGESVWNWCMELLDYARSQDTGGSASVYVSPASPKWSLSNGQLQTTLSISSNNGYSITASDPSVVISGYTGGRSDKLTVTAPMSLSGTDVSLYITATAGSVSTVDLGFYEPDSGTRQKLVFVEMVSGTTGQSKTIPIAGAFYDLTVNKTDAQTGAALDGASFQLKSGGATVGLTETAAGQYTAGGSVTQFTTNGGTASIKGLPAGSYKIEEVSVPTGYRKADAKSITLSQNTSVTIENKPTALTIKKTDAVSDAPIGGAVFTLSDASGNPIAVSSTGDGSYTVDGNGTTTFITNGSGNATIYRLPEADYTLRESPMDGYADHADIPVSFTGANTITVENQPTKLVFTKADALTQEALDGGTFQVLDGNGSVVKLTQLEAGVYRKSADGTDSFTTENGQAILYGLTAAQYTITETVAPIGYTKDADKSVTVTGSGTAAVSMLDDPMTLQFTKTDALSNNPIDGAVFRLFDGETPIKLRKIEDGVYTPDASGSDTFTTHNGVALIAPLEAKTYTISEEQAASGYAAAQDVLGTVTEVNTSKNPTAVSMANAPLALEVRKVDSLTKQPVGGAVFCLFDDRGKIVKVSAVTGRDGWFRADENGTDSFAIPDSGNAVIAYLPQGRYEVKEVEAASGYALPAGTVTTVVGAYNTYTSPASITVENEPLAMLLDKVDALDKSPLANVVFKVKDADGTTLKFKKQDDGSYHVDASGADSFRTDADGKASVLYIPAGDYTLEEQQHTGFAPTKAQDFQVTTENTTNYPAKIGVENWALYLSLTKTDKLDGKVLSNVGFRVLNAEGSALRFTLQEDGRNKVTPTGAELVKTDAAGKVLISHIPAGTYSLVEQAYDGYSLHEPVSVTVENTNTEETPAVIAIENDPTAITLTKTDAETQQPLGGVMFTLKNESGTTVSLAQMQDGSYRPMTAVADADAVASYTETIVTDDAGEAALQYLSYGAYTLEEQQIDGYAPLTDITFTATSDCSTTEPLELSIENIPAVLTISKTDAVTKTALPGTCFMLKDAQGETVQLIQEESGMYRPAKAGETAIKELTIGADGTATVKYLTGTVTIEETGAPAGYAIAEARTVDVGMTPISVVDGNTEDAVTAVAIEDLPLMLRISKLHAKTMKPLKGAAFQLFAESDSTTPLTFTLKDGVYRYSKAGTVTTLTMDNNAQAAIYGLPAGKYKVVESVVPSGFFPAPAQSVTLLLTHTSEKPLEVTVLNTPEVKLGLDSDKWDDVLLIGGALLLAGTGGVLYYRKKRKQGQ